MCSKKESKQMGYLESATKAMKTLHVSVLSGPPADSQEQKQRKKVLTNAKKRKVRVSKRNLHIQNVPGHRRLCPTASLHAMYLNVTEIRKCRMSRRKCRCPRTHHVRLSSGGSTAFEVRAKLPTKILAAVANFPMPIQGSMAAGGTTTTPSDPCSHHRRNVTTLATQDHTAGLLCLVFKRARISGTPKVYWDREGSVSSAYTISGGASSSCGVATTGCVRL
jgi:hypothetical protein